MYFATTSSSHTNASIQPIWYIFYDHFSIKLSTSGGFLYTLEMSSAITSAFNPTQSVGANTTELSSSLGPQDLPAQHQHPEWFSSVCNIGFAILGVLIICGNSLVVYCLLTIKRMRTITGLFLMNLAATDLGVGLISIPITLVSANIPGLVQQQWFCDINGMSMVIFLLASLLTLTTLSIQKYLTVGYQMQSRFTKKIAWRAIGGVWLVASVFALGPVVGWSYYATSRDGHQCGPFAWTLSGRLYSAFIFVIGIVIPITAMSFCYTRLYLNICDHSNRMKVGAVVSRSDLANRRATLRESRMIHTLIIMGFAFITCWSPSAILVILEFAKVEEPLEFEVFALIFAYANSTVNPLIYGLRHEDFRRGFKGILEKLFPRCSNTDEPVHRRNVSHVHVASPGKNHREAAQSTASV